MRVPVIIDVDFLDSSHRLPNLVSNIKDRKNYYVHYKSIKDMSAHFLFIHSDLNSHDLESCW